MSSILKALRKVGEEKRVDQYAAPDLRLDQGLASVESRPLLPLLTGIALGAVTVGLFFLWVKNEVEPAANVRPSVATVQTASIEKKAVDFAAPANFPSESKAPEQSLKALSEAIIVPTVTLSSEPHIVDEDLKGESLPKATVKKQQQPPVASLVSKPATLTLGPTIATATKTPAVEDARLPEGVSLLVTEIFYQQDNANSMAVVNDLPVMIGSHVDSAVVTEVRPEAVLFKIADKVYIVAVSSP